MHALAPLATAIPLLGAAAIAAVATLHPRRTVETAATCVAVTVAVIAGVLAVGSFDGLLVHWFGGWRPQDGVALGVDFAVDPFGAGLALLVAALVAATFVFGWHYFDELGQTYFHVLMLVFLASMVGFALSGDLFNLFVFFELTTVTAVVLTSYMHEEKGPLQGQINFAITNSVGGFLLLTGIAFVYADTGALNLAQIGETLAGREPTPLVVVGFALVLAGFFVKAAVVPFHFWLADAYAVAPAPICVLFAGAMSELGIYGAARVYWTAFEGTLGPYEGGLRAVLVAAGVVTALVGAVMALEQQNLKRLLAFATIAHVGLFLSAVAVLTPDGLAGAGIWAAADGLVKGALFMCVGIVGRQLGALEDAHLHGRGRGLRMTGALYALGALALVTVPPFGTFLGKALAEEAAIAEGLTWLPYVFLVVAALLGGAVLKAGAQVFLGWGPRLPADDAHEEGGEPAAGRGGRVPVFMLAPPALLLAGALALGVAPGLAARTVQSAERFQGRQAYAAAVLEDRQVAVPSSEPAAPRRNDYLLSLAALAGAGLVAAGALRRPRIVIPGGSALHSGHVGDYVTWLVLGTAVFGAAFVYVFR
jgi:multicomponent Na+:H+ antiporter subunit D